MTHMTKLAIRLLKTGIPFEMINNSFTHTPMIKYPNGEDCVCSVICNEFSYGGKKGLLEIMGLTKVDYDYVEGYMTANEVYNRIYKDYHSIKG